MKLFEMEKEVQTKEHMWPPEAGSIQETDSPQEPPEKNRPANTVTLAQEN